MVGRKLGDLDWQSVYSSNALIVKRTDLVNAASAFKQHTGLFSPFVDGMRQKKIAAAVRPGENILDVGCGAGLLIAYLPEQCRYTGIDSNRDTVEFNSKNFSQHKFYCANVLIDALPISEPKFDVVVLGAMLEHVDEKTLLLKKVREVLKPSGRILATTPSRIGGFVHELLARLALLSHEAAEEHKGFLNSKDICALSESAALNVQHYETFQCGLNQFFILTPRQ